MKVVAAVDGSPRSFGALKFVSRILSPACDNITLYFSPPIIQLSGKSEMATDLTESVQSALAESVFKKAQQHLPATFDSLVSSVQGENTPVKGILAIADKIRADLIVLGAHGPTRRLQLFVGGVARGVAHRAAQPVLVVPGNEERDTDEMNILIACDDKSAWRDAAAVLGDFAWPPNTTATLFHVVEEIVKKVREDNFDLLVVNARKLGRVGRLLGSTTEALLIQCPCSLLIVHQQEQP